MDGKNTSVGSHDDPFFNLLQSTVPPPSVIHSTSNQGSKIEDDPFSDFSFNQDDVLPSYDFHPIRSNGGGVNASSSSTTRTTIPIISTARHEESLAPDGSKGRQSSPPRQSYASAEPSVYRSREPPVTYESSIQRLDLMKDSLESATVAAVERTMKKYADVLLRVLEGMSGRLAKLENSTERLEVSVQDLKADAANNHGESDGKLRMLNNEIKEVQRGVQILRDKQEIFEAHSQLVKLQLAKSEAPLSASVDVPTKLLNLSQQETQSEPSVRQPYQSRPQQPALSLEQSPQGAQTPAVAPQQVPAPPPASVSPQQLPLAQQVHSLQPQPQPQHQQPPALPAPPALHSQLPQVREHLAQPSVYPPNASISAPPQVPSLQPYAPSSLAQPQPSHSMQMQSFYSQPPQAQQQQYSHQPETLPYATAAQGPQPQGLHPSPQVSQSQRPHQMSPPPIYHSPETSYPPSATQQGPLPQPQSFQIPPPQHVAPAQQMYDPSFGRSSSGAPTMPVPYIPQAQPLQGPPSFEAQALVPSNSYNSPNYRVAQPSPSAPGGGGYPRLPVAQPVQHSLPHAIPSGPPSLQSRGPADDVVEKVAAMGFSRDQARAVVRRLTESGQPADLNAVLDKLMNGDGEAQPQRGWFSR